MRVFSNQVLATVNETPVHLRDLIPLGQRETAKELTPEQYRSRLQRAIEMELIFQAALVRGIGLTAAQQARLDQTDPLRQFELEHYRKYGLSWSSVGEEEVGFEKRLLEAQLLEQNLVAKSAAVAPSPDLGLQSRYEQARRELLDQLQANAKITKPPWRTRM